MFEIEETVTIDQPIDAVWSFVMDETNDSVWQPTLAEVHRLTEGPMAVGTRVLEVRRFLGRRIETIWEVVSIDEPRVSTIASVTAPFPWSGTYELTATEGGTRFTVALRGDPGGFFRIAEPVLARIARREMAGSLATLKDMLEAGLSDAAALEPEEAAAAS